MRTDAVGKSKRPTRVLHVVGGMNRGGAETWLMHVLRHSDRERVHMDFMVHTDQPCPYDPEIRELGSKVIPCLNPSQPLKFGRNFQRVMEEHGPYDVIHSHIHHYSGYVLRLARRADVPVRISHSHLDTSQQSASAPWLRRRYLDLTRHWIRQNATVGLAASRKAAAALFGEDWEADPRWRILYCSVDLRPFRESVPSAPVRAELGIPEDAFVIGHVGRFDTQKNILFLVDVFAEVAARDSTARMLMVGDGHLRSALEEHIARSGLKHRVILAGLRSDVPRLMMGAMDMFLLPSLWEGLPLVGMEAQAAGLPSLLSDTITEEVDIVKPLVRRLTLDRPASAWADAVLEMRRARRPSRREALAVVEKSPFNITSGVKALERAYTNGA